ncbi:MAG: hypothetical protein ABW039_01645 [Sphingobium sp.]
MRLLLLLSSLLAAPVMAETVVSTATDKVSITVYRAPGRSEGAIDRNWPGGYALISETRTIALPAGESVVRFEGVAEGLMPETAIVSGLPQGVREKNRDARLLSPAGLVDAYLKRSVTLRRTNRQTGAVVEQDAIITAGPQGGVILKTKDGYEALGCSGLPERMLYPQVPGDLSPRPTLSIVAQADRAQRVTLQLVYLAEGFDWAANYVAELGDDGRTLDLLGWLTIANGGVTGFPGAQLNVIAGQPNKENRGPQPRPTAEALDLQCWPMDITSTHDGWGDAPPPPPPPPPPAPMAGYEDVVVTAQRRSESLQAAPVALSVVAEQEDLGDLKFYRVPVAVDVAAKAQKQVALMRQPGVRVERLYAATAQTWSRGSQPMTLRLRLQNRKADGLGLAMPSGGVAVFEDVDGTRLLAGEDDVADKAIGERVDYDIAQSPGVRIVTSGPAKPDGRWRIDLSNARPFDVVAEVTIPWEVTPRPEDMERRGDGWIWRATVPANGKASREFRVKTMR